jgi:hypothetical protein
VRCRPIVLILECLLTVVPEIIWRVALLIDASEAKATVGKLDFHISWSTSEG